MQQQTTHWDSAEKKIAITALEKAKSLETKILISYVKEQASQIKRPDDIWQLHDFLSAKRHDIDGKYDNRDSFLMHTLAKLIKDQLIDFAALEGLSADKKTKITLLTRI
ncbi:MAG: hypothetical protein ACFB0C_16760 [Leptolyngbyaceae cyanobacterium]